MADARRPDRRIDLDAPGQILFFGTMNAAPMMYALELRKARQDVRYFVDVPVSATLSRPESHFKEISYPYPRWITEYLLRIPLLPAFFPRFVLSRMLKRAGIRLHDAKAVFLSGAFIRFAPLLPKSVTKIFFSYGSDLDAWCNVDNTDRLAAGIRDKSFFKALPFSVTKRLIPKIVRRNLAAASQCDFVLFFPPAMSRAGDAVVAKLQAAGVTYVPRYDISFEQFTGLPRAPKPPGRTLVVMSAARFLYKTFTEGTEEYSKGNDLIIRGLAQFHRSHPNLEVHFFEKGEDVEAAKELCRELGLEGVVHWHKEVPFRSLLDFYSNADVCIDQVGRHCVGAAGLYGMYLGRPLIANVRNLAATYPGIPVLQADSSEEVCAHLTALLDAEYREDDALRSKIFAETELGPERVLRMITRSDEPLEGRR